MIEWAGWWEGQGAPQPVYNLGRFVFEMEGKREGRHTVRKDCSELIQERLTVPAAREIAATLRRTERGPCALRPRGSCEVLSMNKGLTQARGDK